ncbi:MAG: RNA polymerase Rpb4 family protein [Candidatus Syntropharchaeia archaeon]
MIIKEIVNEELLTLAEVKEILSEIREREKDEMRHEKRKALDHCNRFAKIDAKRSRKLVNELMKLEKMREEIAIRIVDIMPRSKDELRTIYAKEKFTLTDEDFERILDIIGG